MAVNSGTTTSGQSGWAVYYRGPHAVVTSWYIENAKGRHPVHHLRNVRQVHVRTYPTRAVALFTGAVELALTIPLATVYGSATLLCTGFVATFGIASAALVDGRRNPRWMALIASYQGRDVELFSTRDKREFEQVRRAVIRAVELDRELWL